MAKPDKEIPQPESPPAAEAWGTWEELLLAYAVNRFGTNSWESVSSELRKRTSAQIYLNPHHCKQKYEELERRFAKSNGDDVETAVVPWIEELRQLRVAELQRQLKNFDIYILSLQLKVKKLTEKSEKNSCGDAKEKPDLGQQHEIEIKSDEDVKYNLPDPVISGEEQVPAGGESDRDNQSVNGSNGTLETGAVAKQLVNDLCNGGPVSNHPVRAEPDEAAGDSPGSESEGTIGENSDAASKSKKERSDTVRRGCSKADELESIPVRSLPLVDILQQVCRLGSAVFERRLDRQEKLRYKNLIKQHIDLEILQTRLKEGRYSDGNNNFFRDLLLLVNNTHVFFSNGSTEFIAATELQQFITKEMTSKRKQKSVSKLMVEKLSSNSKPQASEPKLAIPMVGCRKRSSIMAKMGPDKREEETDMKMKKQSELKNKRLGVTASGGSSGRQPEESESLTKKIAGRPGKRAAQSSTSDLKQTKKRSKR